MEASPRPGSVGPSLVPNGDQCLQNELVISLTDSGNLSLEHGKSNDELIDGQMSPVKMADSSAM